jgi:hypothetical protein
MFGFSSGASKIDSRWVELIMVWLVSQKYNWFYLKLENVAFDSKIDFYTNFFCSSHFYMNMSKHRSLYLQLNFGQNLFYRINYAKINFTHRRTNVHLMHSTPTTFSNLKQLIVQLYSYMNETN